MHILIAVATKHGSTHGIGEAVAEVLKTRGHDVDVAAVGDIDSIGAYDAVIIGSAVYLGHWLPEARKFAETHTSVLIGRPVWLFSSGPVGGLEARRPEEPADLLALMKATKARGHRTFRGKLDPTQMSLADRLMVKLTNAPAGDFRDWEAIQNWAEEIADNLQTAHRPEDELANTTTHSEISR